MERAETVPLRMLTTPRLRPMFIVGMLLVFFQSHLHRVVRGVVGSGAMGDAAGDLLAAHPRRRRRRVRDFIWLFNLIVALAFPTLERVGCRTELPVLRRDDGTGLPLREEAGARNQGAQLGSHRT